MDTKLLKDIGLTDLEIDVYYTLLKIGPSSAKHIARRAEKHRTNVYDALDKLMKKGLVSYTMKEDIKIFNATEPNRLLLYVKDKKQELEKRESMVKKLISELESIKQYKHSEAQIQIFQGKEGLRSFYEKLINVAKSGDSCDIIGTTEKITGILKHYVLNVTKLASLKNIKGRMIISKRMLVDKQMKRVTSFAKVELKAIPKKLLTPTAIILFKDYVGLFNYTMEPFVVLIKNKQIVDTYEQYFEGIWEIGKEV